ncbi:MAG: hypothetical protein WB368_05615, partial [Candidatus Sulfotelmatobacter sp.]
GGVFGLQITPVLGPAFPFVGPLMLMIYILRGSNYRASGYYDNNKSPTSPVSSQVDSFLLFAGDLPPWMP